MSESDFDIIIAGGGPAGATAALHASRIGLKVCLLEKSQHPRFHIGESMLPQSYPLFKKLGIVDALWKLPHVDKLGAEFILGDGDGGAATFTFINGLIPGELTFNIERSHFDRTLIEQVKLAGATVRENTTVDEILRLHDGDVAVRATTVRRELTPSPGTPGEGGGEGDFEQRIALDDRNHPHSHPSPLPEYRERGPESPTAPSAETVRVASETITGRYLFDCTGQQTLLGRHLKARKNFTEPELQKVAYFAHFDHVDRLPGKASGYPSIVMCKEGWFWIIGLDEIKTSIGFVTRPEFAKELNVPADRLLAAAIARCPVLQHRMRNASGPAIDSGINHVMANFSYRCRPYAGDGYFMVGDAAAFLDPIFSTGVLLAMRTGMEAADHVKAILAGERSPAKARRQYIRFFNNSTDVFWKLIRAFYKHSFRELFLNQEGPYQMHRAVSAILAGHVFPKPAWKLTWRLWAFHLSVLLQKYVKLVPRRREFSLLAQPPQQMNLTPSAEVSESLQAVAV